MKASRPKCAAYYFHVAVRKLWPSIKGWFQRDHEKRAIFFDVLCLN